MVTEKFEFGNKKVIIDNLPSKTGYKKTAGTIEFRGYKIIIDSVRVEFRKNNTPIAVVFWAFKEEWHHKGSGVTIRFEK